MLGNIRKLNLSILLVAAVSASNAVTFAKEDLAEKANLTHDDAGEILDHLEKNLTHSPDLKKAASAAKTDDKSMEKPAHESVEQSVEPLVEKSAKNSTASAPEAQTDEKQAKNPASLPPEQRVEAPATKQSLETAQGAKSEDSPRAPGSAEKTGTTNAVSTQSDPAPKRSIKDIEAKIQEYDSRIDILESDLARIQSSLHDASVTDNKVLIEVRTQNQAKFVIRDLAAKLDGSSLYDQKDSAGIWMPNQTIAVFHGPLKPGNHSINIQAIISPLSNDGLKLPTWQHKTIESVFDIEIPEGRSRKRFVVELSDDADSSSKPRAKIAESDYK